MNSQRDSVYEILFGPVVKVLFASLIITWFVFEAQLVPKQAYVLLIPVWVPTFIAFSIADSIRTVTSPLLSGGLLFDIVVFLVLYVEAVCIAGVSTYCFSIYQRYIQDSNSS